MQKPVGEIRTCSQWFRLRIIVHPEKHHIDNLNFKHCNTSSTKDHGLLIVMSYSENIEL